MLALIVAIVVSELAGIIGSVFTTSSIAGWYAGIVKPALNPPAWVFGPVWTTLFALMGINAGATLGPVNETNMKRIWNKHKINTSLKPKVFVGMSGGVDSSVAAALLKEHGFDVVGVHIKMWGDPEIPCTSKEDRYDAMRAAAHLGIQFETWDLTSKYKQAVVEYMIAEYAAGRTPNPDVMCNREIKFGVFLARALADGADFMATGHYVRRLPSGFEKYQNALPMHSDSVELLAHPPLGGYRGRSGFKSFQNHLVRYRLLQGIDQNKDQSYFLWTLTQERLRYCLFPIGEHTKPEVRVMAKKFGLPNADKPDSQGICFIGEIDMTEFLKKYIPVWRGSVVTTGGKTVGEHEGLSFYTIGQRHGIEIGGGIPYYVAEKNIKTNTLVVAEGPYDEKLFANELAVSGVNWISGAAPKLPLQCEARIRYRQPLQKCVVSLCYPERGEGSRRDASPPVQHDLHVVFDEPQRAVTPGQSVVFYRDNETLGGGIIA